jgi:hypothetical protein
MKKMHAMCAMLLAAGAVVTGAAPAGADGNGAQVINWNGYVMSYDGVPVSVPVTCQTVVTPDGNASQVCHGSTENPTGNVVTWSGESTGMVCFPTFPLYFGTPSANWQEVITPSGQITFTCNP